MAVDPNIKKKADDIRNKIYGKEVRESLASGLEEMSSNVVENEGRQSNVEQRQSTVEDRQTDVENRFDDQIAGNTDIDEVIDARRPEGVEAYPTLRRRLDEEHQEVTAQLAQTVQKINERSILLTDYGAVGDYGVTDNTQSFLDALAVANSPEYTLIIPAGGFYISDSIEIECNVISLGEILVPNNVSKTFITFPAGEQVKVNGSNMIESIKKGQSQIQLNSTFNTVPITDLSKYYYVLDSTETLITRIGRSNFTPYTKLEGGEFRKSSDLSANTRNEILCDYNDFSTITITLSKKLPSITIEGLTVKRINKGTYTNLQTLVDVKRNNIVFNNLTIDNVTKDPLQIGLRILNTHNIKFNSLLIKNVYGSGDNYALLNSGGSYIYFDDFTYEEQNNNPDKRKGYVARNGNHVYFNHVNLYGIDDHYGYNYFLKNSSITGGGISFAGKNFEISDTTFSDLDHAFHVRDDTPHAEGTLLMKNVDFNNVGVVLRYARRTDPLNRQLTGLKCFDHVKLKDINIGNSYITRDDFNGGAIFLTNKSSTGTPEQWLIHMPVIEFENVISDKKLMSFHVDIPFIIDEIIINNCDVTVPDFTTNPHGVGIRALGNQKIGKITFKDSTNLASNFEETDVVDEIIIDNCDLGTNDQPWLIYSDTIVRFKNNLMGNHFHVLQKVSLENNVFTNPLNHDFMRSYTELLYSKNNIAEVGITERRLPVLDGYVNENYYFTKKIKEV